MDVTETSGTWRLTQGTVHNCRTGVFCKISNMPSDNEVAMMHERTFVRKCKEAFETTIWPK